MPESRQNYNTRLRTNAQILPPRRLRNDPSPPPQHRRPSKLKNPSQNIPPSPQFPPPNTLFHPDDAANKTFLAIGRTLLAVDNRAVTIKDLSQLTLEHGLVCQNASAASQAITTFIRNHLNRCREERSMPLLLSLPLSGTEADDQLAPALHSRSGGTSASARASGCTLTNFRRGTTVWYLSEAAGAPCPFKRAGLSVDDITLSHPNGTKRKRDTQHNLPRKLQARGPAMATRHRQNPDEHDTEAMSRPRIKLTIRMKNLSSMSSSESSEPESDINDPHSDADSDSDIPSQSARGLSVSSDDSSDVESSIHVDEPELIPDGLQSYPQPHFIPSTSCSTPLTSLASPSVPYPDPFSAYLSSNLCSSHFIKTTYTSFRTALSNPPPDLRARSSSLPFSAASPPPDSEDEDEDYHNSMVGLRRDSFPFSLKEEDVDEQDTSVSRCDATAPKNLSCLDTEDPAKREEADTTPLEVLPGFVPFSIEPELSRLSVKDEQNNAALPPAQMFSVKLEQSIEGQTVFDQIGAHPPFSSLNKGSKSDPVCIDIVGDVEVLGPESVRSREWDAAWSLTEHQTDNMDLDRPPDTTQSSSPLHFDRPDVANDCLSPTSAAQESVSSPLAPQSIALDLGVDVPIVVYPLRSCEPEVIATVIDGIPVYRTFMAPHAPLIRRMDNSFVNITLLQSFLQLPLSTVLCNIPSPRLTISRVAGLLSGTWVPLAVAQTIMRRFNGRVPQGIETIFLSVDLHFLFPDALERLVPNERKTIAEETVISYSRELSHGFVKDACIRVEDLFIMTDCGETKHKRFKSDVFDPQTKSVSRSSSLILDTQRIRDAPVPVPLSEQEERLFHSFVDVFGAAAGYAPPSVPSTTTPTRLPPMSTSVSSSPLSTPPTSPTLKPAVVCVPFPSSSSQEKENAVADKRHPVRCKREKVDVPVRRSKRTLTSKVPITRSRSKGN